MLKTSMSGPLDALRRDFDALASNIYSCFRKLEDAQSSSSSTAYMDLKKKYREAIGFAQKLSVNVVARVYWLRHEHEGFSEMGMMPEAETVSLWLGECEKWEKRLNEVVGELKEEVCLLERGI